MKNSGIEWIGDIPDSWETKTIKQLLIERIEKNSEYQTSTILSLSAKDGVTLYDGEHHAGNRPREDLSDYKVVYPNDIVANSMNILSGSVGLSSYKGCVSPVYYIYHLRSNDDIEFLHYIFQCKQFQLSLRGLGNGIMIKESGNGNLNTIRMRIPAQKLAAQVFPYCSLEEQKKIVAYLNAKLSQVDELIANQQGQIEKLKEYKQSVITEAVTKGLDKSAPLKDSGIEWIGEIPVHWDTIKIKFTSWLKGRIGWDGLKSTEFIEEGPFLITGTDFENGSINWNSCVHISEQRFMEDELLHIKENDLLITKDGTIGKLAIVRNCPEKVSLNSGVMIIRNSTDFKYFDKYLYYLLQSRQFLLWYELSQSGGSTIRHLYQGQFYNFEYTYPILNEQKEIAFHLDEKCGKIDRLIAIKQEKIEKLQEYKKSLIYEYVTGKKEVV